MTDNYLNIINEISNYVNIREDLNPYKLHADISSNYYSMARDTYKKIINNNLILGIIGYSSNLMRIHYLYKGEDNTLYIVHSAYGNINDAFYLTQSIVSCWFDGFENEMSELKLTDKVNNYLNNLVEE